MFECAENGWLWCPPGKPKMFGDVFSELRRLWLPSAGKIAGEVCAEK